MIYIKAKTISLKVFKIMDFKNFQQEITKRTLRPSEPETHK